MIGYFNPNKKDMPIELKKEYNSIYCALCHALKNRFGVLGISSLSYAITLVMTVILGLSDQEPDWVYAFCSVSPCKYRKLYDYDTPWFEDAAQIAFLTVMGEIKDNSEDERRLIWRLIYRVYKLGARKADQGLICQFSNAYEEFTTNEKTDDFYSILKASGYMTAKMLSPLYGYVASDRRCELNQLFSLLGEWMFLMDECDDLDVDYKNGIPNSLKKFSKPKDVAREEFIRIQREIIMLTEHMHFCYHKKLIDYILVKNLSRESEKALSKL